ncbi:MAG: hypothetical protein L3J24_05180 [Xanthomonadales bacterium]|nr:hypothetical protein [Xanthomonadales bacterium]
MYLINKQCSRTKRWANRTLLFALLLGLTSSAFSTGDVFELRKSTFDGGGGLSIGGNFQLTGTIAQHDAGSSQGGIYRIQGGFWTAPPLPDALFSDSFENP